MCDLFRKVFRLYINYDIKTTYSVEGTGEYNKVSIKGPC